MFALALNVCHSGYLTFTNAGNYSIDNIGMEFFIPSKNNFV